MRSLSQKCRMKCGARLLAAGAGLGACKGLLTVEWRPAVVGWEVWVGLALACYRVTYPSRSIFTSVFCFARVLRFNVAFIRS